MAQAPRKRGRPPNKAPTKKVSPSLDEPTLASLDQLVSKGYGKNPSDVARYFIKREIDDLKRAGVLAG